jgi:Alpha/beta hydrolase of unknown function (DUF900)
MASGLHVLEQRSGQEFPLGMLSGSKSHTMSHYITVPIDANGVIDPDEKIQDIITMSMSAAFGTTDVFIYSHGWWTTADAALKQYNVATTGFIFFTRNKGYPKKESPMFPFLIGVHWPSTVEDDPAGLLNFLEPLTFYTMEKRADDIGQEGLYAILRLIFSSTTPETNLRINLFGHSFGCKVVCAALEELALNDIPVPVNIRFNVILLQAAFATDRLDPSNTYGHVIPKFGPRLRMLISKSEADTALCDAFPKAHEINLFAKGVRTALGATGPSNALVAAFPSHQAVTVNWDSSFLGSELIPHPGPGIVVADLTPFHKSPNNKYVADPSGGHHSDIFQPQIYDLMGWFIFG